MALIGPIVRNDVFFFVTILALVALMVLLEYRRRADDYLVQICRVPGRNVADGDLVVDLTSRDSRDGDDDSRQKKRCASPSRPRPRV